MSVMSFETALVKMSDVKNLIFEQLEDRTVQKIVREGDGSREVMSKVLLRLLQMEFEEGREDAEYRATKYRKKWSKYETLYRNAVHKINNLEDQLKKSTVFYDFFFNSITPLFIIHSICSIHCSIFYYLI